MDRDSNGFTLLEVLIALCIVSGLLLTAISSVNYNLSVSERHETVTTAAMLAREKITKLRQLNVVEEKGQFEPPYESYSYRLISRMTALTGVAIMELTVYNKKESVTVRYLYKTS
ncbi:MAG: prepilin-type N-terminal cleavage/methylation domain-containing protein [Nitrospirae bacterium]|nr:prepilin-type N-terminal cleavage/methylation domain-containing protein [Nitrospirota bacterium]MBF0535067.1 prepilin-type N-terminal cleavage/methylation domain-containing protein [Nitrospirota bacterium]MBF0616575.1 prepilin-type N-terminal cleavage/methylation domain-containing protein [Nitrospirota bacterium]